MNHPLHLVCMGGGTGLPQLLTGVRVADDASSGSGSFSLARLTVVVTSFDDGGSSGRIVEAYGTLPPGDLRNCLIALADEQVEPLLTRFFNFRFRDDEHEALAGHSVGNLLLLTLSQVYGGDIRRALLAVRQILPIRSNILFPTLSPSVLCARLSNGTVVKGESRIARREDRAPISDLFLEHRDPATQGGFPSMEGLLDAIRTADVLTLGPGSLYTSILPHFLVDGVAEAFRASPAVKVYICNLMTEAGETDGFSVADHVRRLEERAGITVDIAIVNNRPVSLGLRTAYERERSKLALRTAWTSLERALERAWSEPSGAPAFAREAEKSWQKVSAVAYDLSHPGGSFIQVLPRAGEEVPSHLRLEEADLLADVEVTEQNGGTKRVIRHDPLKLIKALERAVAGGK